MIGLGDQTWDDQAYRQVTPNTMGTNGTYQNTEDNLANVRIMRSMASQGLTQLWSFGRILFVVTDDCWRIGLISASKNKPLENDNDVINFYTRESVLRLIREL